MLEGRGLASRLAIAIILSAAYGRVNVAGSIQ
jgi:hypothetical protein